MKEIVTTVATILDETDSGSEIAVDTIGSRSHITADARFFLDVTSLTGSGPTMDVDILATVGGVAYVLGSFTQVNAASSEVIVITNCPSMVEVTYTAGGTVSDFDATVICVRF